MSAALKQVKVAGLTAARVMFDADWEEYRVVPKGCRANDPAVYFTSDREDAIDTARAMERASEGAAA